MYADDSQILMQRRPNIQVKDHIHKQLYYILRRKSSYSADRKVEIYRFLFSQPNIRKYIEEYDEKISNQQYFVYCIIICEFLFFVVKL